MAETKVSAEQEFSQQVRNVLKGTTSPICTGGSLKLESAPTISLKSGESFEIKPAAGDGRKWRGDEREKSQLSDQVKNLQGLLDKIPQAAFGQGKETVYNKDVRDALQLPANDFDIDIPQEKIDIILDQVKKDLNLKTDICAERYSLNAYQEGGKFLKHKDTPRGDDMLGTLVICLPSLFWGGHLRITMGKIDSKFFKACSFNEHKGGTYGWWNGTDSANELPWAAFFSDVDHEIMKVSKGLRLIVAYMIRRKDTQSAASCLPRSLEASEQESVFQEELGKALKNEEFLADGGKIASPCVHLYTNKEVFPGKADSDQPLSYKQISKLKGRDLMIASVAFSFGLKVLLVPYLSHSCQGDEGDLRLSKFPKKKKCPRYMSGEDVETFFDGHRPSDEMCSEENDPSSDADVWILQYGDEEQAEKEVGSTDNYNEEGYYGNEASHTSFYVKAALFLEVPDYFEGRGEQASSQANKKLKTK